MESGEAFWLWLGVAGMAAGTVAFMLLSRADREEHVHHYVTHWMITVVAAVAYLAMAMGQGRVETANAGRSFAYARYVDWAITTPLLLLGLAALALPHEHLWQAPELTLGLIGTDILMILTGLFAALSSDASAKWTWYLVSCGAFLAVLYILYGPLRAHTAAFPDDERRLFMRALVALTVVWFAYPLVWIFGTQGIATLSATTETALYTALDLLAKVAYGGFVLAGVRQLPPFSALAVHATARSVPDPVPPEKRRDR